eukprot:scaffold6027_cov117-Isochrysis_galbana.AAC.3
MTAQSSRSNIYFLRMRLCNSSVTLTSCGRMFRCGSLRCSANLGNRPYSMSRKWSIVLTHTLDASLALAP